ncbi:RNA pseudouridine synthase [Brumimicrobium salinarum]|uniref:RNA pseudouridine synthase n=1 Tax=Brumimicrobium salinarum TaxID=2058658 RepID=A0A2I0R0Y3_9FLAO|nr:RluA family pseudouridine synthase [Brumimicrobium salinarum]PKR80252.1 RNA pseudouridine synthase [Brumimicrobium salinarum]
MNKIEIEHLIVQDLERKTRIYDYLNGKLTSIPTRKGLKKAFSRKQIYLNGELSTTADFVKDGDEINIYEREKITTPYFELDLKIIYEDEELAVVEKPAGIPVSGNVFKSIQNAIPHHLALSNSQDRLVIPLPVHRLDQLTHGLLIIAKSYHARVDLGKQFENQRIEKKYMAIVQGRLLGSGTLNTAIEQKKSITHYTSLAVYPSVKNQWISVLELRPVTGRKHQIRIHLSRLGFPIIGDQRYGKPGNTLKHKGLFLSAVALKFNHPKTNEVLSFQITPPNKFSRFLEREAKWVARIGK